MRPEAFFLMLIDAIAGLSLGIWAYLIVGRGGFWLGSVRDEGTAGAATGLAGGGGGDPGAQ